MFYEFDHLGSAEYFVRETGKDFNFPSHIHQCFELITVLSGQMTVTIDNKVYDLKKSDSVLIFPNQIHSLSSEQCEHLLFIFSPNLVSAYNSVHSYDKPVDNKFILNKFQFKELEELSADSDLLYKKGILYLICDSFNKTAQYTPTENKSLLEKVFNFISENFSKECSLNEVSKSIGYNPSYISRHFKKITGIAFNDYVNIYRLNHACYLLQNTNKSIIECSLESGFNSIRTFNRNFKESYGIPPSEYQKVKISPHTFRLNNK